LPITPEIICLGAYSLGLGPAELERHIAWDIGVRGVCRLMGDALGAVVIGQNYSRLAIDCNRMPGSETSIVEVSERTTVPGNIGLGKTQVEARHLRPHDCEKRATSAAHSSISGSSGGCS
jgi:predicted N-formylglutamate amidohydrolase